MTSSRDRHRSTALDRRCEGDPDWAGPLDGTWKGRLIDVTGVRTVVELHVRESDGELKGDFSARFVPEEDGCGGSRPRVVQSGAIAGTYDREAGRVRLKYGMTVGLDPVEVIFRGAIRRISEHSQPTIVGCFDSEEEDPLTLQGGCGVLWKSPGRS